MEAESCFQLVEPAPSLVVPAVATAARREDEQAESKKPCARVRGQAGRVA